MCKRSLTLATAVLTFTVFVPESLPAQQAEIPAKPSEGGAAAGDGQTERIVESRPKMYPVKRILHPISWVYAGIRPFLTVAEKVGENLPSNSESASVSGIKFRLTSLGPGSGIGAEIKPFHHDFLSNKVEIDVPLAITNKLYQSFGFRANYPLLSGDSVERVGLEFSGVYGSRPLENFFGIGNETAVASQSRFRTVSRSIALALDTRLTETWAARIEGRYRNVGITKPRNFTSTQDVEPQTLPGLLSGATMRSIAASLRYDTRDRRALPDRSKAAIDNGSLQQLEASVNEGGDGDDFSYWRFRYTAQQFFPLKQDNGSVIALRGELETNREKGGGAIPFFDLPAIGSPETLPGFQPRRFADKSALGFSAEYRYRIWRHFDWSLFVSQGQVAPQIGDFGLGRFHTGYGMRFLVRPTGDHSIALDIGHSHEGWVFYLDFSPAF